MLQTLLLALRNLAGVNTTPHVRFSSNQNRAKRYTFHYNNVRLGRVPRGGGVIL